DPRYSRPAAGARRPARLRAERMPPEARPQRSLKRLARTSRPWYALSLVASAPNRVTCARVIPAKLRSATLAATPRSLALLDALQQSASSRAGERAAHG